MVNTGRKGEWGKVYRAPGEYNVYIHRKMIFLSKQVFWSGRHVDQMRGLLIANARSRIILVAEILRPKCSVTRVSDVILHVYCCTRIINQGRIFAYWGGD